VDDEAYQRSIITTSLQTETHKGEILTLYPHKLYCLNPHYADADTPAGVADWMKLVTESISHPRQPDLNLGRAIIQKAAQAIDEDGLTPQERAEAIDRNEFEEKLEHDVSKVLKNTARKMLADGLRVDLIIKYTGLSHEELAALVQP
jgi:hypothetical protein